MIINPTNINKTKESLNSGGPQFHQYQQNKRSPIILTELLEQTEDHDIWRWNPGPGFGQVHKCGGVKPVNRIQPLLSWWLDLQRQYIYKQTIKNMHIFASTQKEYAYYHKN